MNLFLFDSLVLMVILYYLITLLLIFLLSMSVSSIITLVFQRSIPLFKTRKRLANFLSSLISGILCFLLSLVYINNSINSVYLASFGFAALVMILAFVFNERRGDIEFIRKSKIVIPFIVILIIFGFFSPKKIKYIDNSSQIGEKITEASLCGPNKNYSSTGDMGKCLGKKVELIGALAVQEKNGENIYFFNNPRWGNREEVGDKDHMIFLEFQKDGEIQPYLKKEIILRGRLDTKEELTYSCTDASGRSFELIVSPQEVEEKLKPIDIQCSLKNQKMDFIVKVEQVDRYISPETWAWVDGYREDKYKYQPKSKIIVNKEVTKTGRLIPFVPGSVGGYADCLFLDDPEANRKFKEIVLSGTENGSWGEYEIANIEIVATGPLERRVYDYGECCKCPPGVYCDCAPCGEHTFECVIPTTLERKNDDGLKYGVNWFAGYITNPNLEKKSPNPYSDLKSYLQNYNLPLVKIKDDSGNIIKTYGKMMFLHSQYPGDFLYQIVFDYILVFKNESLYPTREDVFDHPIKLKVYGEKVKAEYCVRPLRGPEDCMPRSLILVEKIIDEKGENIIATQY